VGALLLRGGLRVDAEVNQMSRFFTADTHFGHKNIKVYMARPWSTNDEMREGLIERWNAAVKPFDEVWVLGDFSFGGAGFTSQIVPRLNGRKRLIKGNHDGYRPDRYTGWGFESATAEPVEILIRGIPVLMCHYPYAGDHTDEDRYLDRRPVDAGKWLLHGHIHNKWRILGRQINVGVDAWDWSPVSEEVLFKEMAPCIHV